MGARTYHRGGRRLHSAADSRHRPAARRREEGVPLLAAQVDTRRLRRGGAPAPQGNAVAALEEFLEPLAVRLVAPLPAATGEQAALPGLPAQGRPGPDPRVYERAAGTPQARPVDPLGTTLAADWSSNLPRLSSVAESDLVDVPTFGHIDHESVTH